MFLKYNKYICRICLEKDGLLYKLSDLPEYFETFSKLTEFPEFPESNEFPDNICQRCKCYLKICHKFRLAVIDSNEKLLAFLSNVNKNIESVSFNIINDEIELTEVKTLLPAEDRIEINNLEENENKYVKTVDPTDKIEYLDESFLDEDYININNKYINIEDEPKVKELELSIKKRRLGNRQNGNQLRKFKQFWLDLFKPWLSNINGRAFCKYCSASLENIFGHIKRHSQTTKHEKNTLIFEESNKHNLDINESIQFVNKNADPLAKKLDCTTTNSPNKRRRFKEFWLDIFKPWLCEINGQAHCRYCCSKIENILSHIERHLSTTKHLRNATMYVVSGKELPSEEKIIEFLKDCKQITCDYCNKSFSCKESLQLHIMRSHVNENGVAKFECGQCNRRFNLIASIKAHLQQHPIHKPVFKCFKCKEKFARKATLKNHMFECIENFETGNCFDCDLNFKDFDSYLYHFNEVHRKADYDVVDENCWICGNNFNSESDIREHLLNHDIIEL